jgi:hypothetical protein
MRAGAQASERADDRQPVVHQLLLHSEGGVDDGPDCCASQPLMPVMPVMPVHSAHLQAMLTSTSLLTLLSARARRSARMCCN